MREDAMLLSCSLTQDFGHGILVMPPSMMTFS